MDPENLSVLVEFRESKRPVVATPRTLLDQITLEVKKIDSSVIIVKSLDDFNEGDGKPVLLQRYSTLWNEYIDVLDPMEVDDGDRLRIIPFPKGGLSPTKSTEVRNRSVFSFLRTAFILFCYAMDFLNMKYIQ